MKRIGWALVMVVVAGLTGCGDGGDDVLPPGVCFIDQGRFTDLSASSGTTPRLSWCGAPANALSVRFAESQTVVWRIACTEELLCIDPGLTYGQLPADTEATVPPEPLRASTQYELCLFGIDDNPETVCGRFQT